ncbi:hypothetical protein AAZX31_02G264100 [Glycine max]
MVSTWIKLIAVVHQVITPMGCKSSVDSRLIFGAIQKIIEARAARKKEEYLKNPDLAQIFFYQQLLVFVSFPLFSSLLTIQLTLYLLAQMLNYTNEKRSCKY